MSNPLGPAITQRRRIIFVTVADLPEGGGRTGRLRTLVSTFVSLGHRVEIWNEHGLTAGASLNGTVARVSASGELGGAPFHYVLGQTQRRHGFNSIRMKIQAVGTISTQLRRSAQAGPVDLVVLNNLSFYDTFPITRLARQLGIRTVQCYEDDWLELLPDPNGEIGFARRVFGLNAWLSDRYCSRMADAIFVISTYLQQKYRRLSGHPDRVHLIPTIVDCNAWQLPPEPEPHPPTLLYAGGLGPQDDLHGLARALSGLKQGGMRFRLVLAGCHLGERPLDCFMAYCRRQGIEKDVEVLGFLRHEQLKAQMARSHLLVNLRRHSVWSASGLSTKLSEYLASGRAVLTTDLGDNVRYVEHEHSAFVVSPQSSTHQLAQVLRCALTDRKLRLRVGAGGRRVAETHFDLPVIRERLRGILATILNKAPSPRPLTRPESLRDRKMSPIPKARGDGFQIPE